MCFLLLDEECFSESQGCSVEAYEIFCINWVISITDETIKVRLFIFVVIIMYLLEVSWWWTRHDDELSDLWLIRVGWDKLLSATGSFTGRMLGRKICRQWTKIYFLSSWQKRTCGRRTFNFNIWYLETNNTLVGCEKKQFLSPSSWTVSVLSPATTIWNLSN